MATVGKLQDGTLKVAGEINERLPMVTNGLITYYPFDGTIKKCIPFQFRYIRDWVNGSTANTSSHWAEIQAIDGNNVNIALNKTAYINGSPSSLCPALVDGSIDTTQWQLTNMSGGSGLQARVVDLGNLYAIQKIIIWHYYGDARIYHNSKTEVSEDGILWYSIFDSNIEGEYAETAGGHTIDLTNLGTTCNPLTNINNTLTNDGIAIEESTSNLWNGLTTTGSSGGWSVINNPFNNCPFKAENKVIKCTPRSYMNYYTIYSTDQVNYPIGTTFTFQAWCFVEQNCDCMGPIFIGGEQTNSGSSQYDKTKYGTWQHLQFTSTSVSSTTYPTWAYYFLLYPNTGSGSNTWTTGNVYFANVQIEKKSYTTSYVNNSRTDGSFKINNGFDYSTDFSLFSFKKNITDGSILPYALTNASNVFTMYINNTVNSTYVNKWVGYAMKGVNQTNKTWNISSYNNPSSKFYSNDFIQKSSFYSYSLAVNNCGYLWRTFLYCSANVTIWHRYVADNGGGIRVNNGTPQNLGGWMDPSTNSSNPDVRIDLVKGWNMVEIWYMDYDTGGGLSLQRNSQGLNATGVDTGTSFVDSIPLSSVPQVLYMTAEMPIEFSNNMIQYNEKSNVFVKQISVYNRALSSVEISKLSSTKFDLNSNGNINNKINERINKIPLDAYYYPLGYDTLDQNKIYNSTTNTNLLYEKGSVWVGSTITNQIINPDGTIGQTAPGSYQPGWDNSLHPTALTVSNWSGGYNAGVPSPTIGYHAQWVREGMSGPYDVCMKFIDRNDIYSLGHRWLGISNVLGTPTSLGWAVGTNITISWYQKSDVLNKGIQAGIYHKRIDNGTMDFESCIQTINVTKINTWEKVSFTYTITSNWDLTTACSIYLYGQYGSYGTLWADRVQVQQSSYPSPYVGSSNGAGKLEYNLNSSLGLDWSGNWSIVYWKMPIGTYTGDMNGYNLESLGCNSNSVGTGYIFWGKNNGSNTIYSSAPSAFNVSDYFGKYHMISLVKNGTTLTIKEWFNGGPYVRTTTLNGIVSNYYVNQYGYDFMLGGWDNSNSVNSYYRDLIIAKRAFTDAEIDAMRQTQFIVNGTNLQIQNNISENCNL